MSERNNVIYQDSHVFGGFFHVSFVVVNEKFIKLTRKILRVSSAGHGIYRYRTHSAFQNLPV